jgi:hypothetical protein
LREIGFVVADGELDYGYAAAGALVRQCAVGVHLREQHADVLVDERELHDLAGVVELSGISEIRCLIRDRKTPLFDHRGVAASF